MYCNSLLWALVFASLSGVVWSGRVFKTPVSRVFKTPVSRVFSPRHKLIMSGNFTELKRINKLRETFDIRSYPRPQSFLKSEKQPLRDYYDAEYLGWVSVGTPRQQFRVVMDTGSSNFWITDKDCSKNQILCKKYCLDYELCYFFGSRGCWNQEKTKASIGQKVDTCKGHTLFDSQKSSTFKPVNKEYYVAYGTGDARGKVGKDTVAFGDKNDQDALVVAGAEVGQTTLLGSFFYGREIDGIMGLAFESLSVANMVPPFIQAYRQNLVDPIMTVWLDKKGYKETNNGGVITYGDFDSENCEREEYKVSLSSATYWQFGVDKISVNGRAFTGGEAISDTGTSFLLLPNEIYEAILDAVGAVKGEGDGPYTKCSKKINLGITISGKTFRLTQQELLIEMERGRAGWCYVAVSPSGGSDIILGDPWIRGYCQVHRFAERKIGFAKAKHSK